MTRIIPTDASAHGCNIVDEHASVIGHAPGNAVNSKLRKNPYAEFTSLRTSDFGPRYHVELRDAYERLRRDYENLQGWHEFVESDRDQAYACVGVCANVFKDLEARIAREQALNAALKVELERAKVLNMPKVEAEMETGVDERRHH